MADLPSFYVSSTSDGSTSPWHCTTLENLLSATTSLAEILEAGNLPPSLPQVERSPCPSPLNIHHHPSPSLYSCFKYPSLLSKGITPLHLLKPSKLTNLLSPIPRTLKLRSHPSPIFIGMARVTSPKLHRVNLNGRAGIYHRLRACTYSAVTPHRSLSGRSGWQVQSYSRVNLSGRAGCSCL